MRAEELSLGCSEAEQGEVSRNPRYSRPANGKPAKWATVRPSEIVLPSGGKYLRADEADFD